MNNRARARLWRLYSILVLIAAAGSVRAESLAQAVAAGKVHVTVSALGGSSGDTLKVTAWKTPATGGALHLTLPAGTRLTSADGAVQDMVVARVRGRMVGARSFTPTDEITVNGATAAAFIVEAYCAEFHKKNPPRSSRFTLAGADAGLACVLQEARKRGLSVQATQAAVWIRTDGVTFEGIQRTFPVSAADWAAARKVADHCRRTGN